MTILKTLIFLAVFPGIVLVYAPCLILYAWPSVIHSETAHYTALLPWLLGVSILLWCVRDFVFKGGGTPAPIDPPKKLVVQGLYRFVRNPMYIGVLLVLIGHILWFQSLWLAMYAVLVFLVFHLFVVLYEEPALRKTFGDSYVRYCQKVPRWMPRVFR